MDDVTPSHTRPKHELPEPFANVLQFDHDLLMRFGFDVGMCSEQMRAVRERRVDPETAIIRVNVQPVHGIPEIRFDHNAGEKATCALGVQALARGEVAVLLLNGGLATRFGGVVKCAVDVFDGRSFLELKLADVQQARQLFGANIPLVIMNSFATRQATEQLLHSQGSFTTQSEDLLLFDQSVSVRLTATGEPFIGQDDLARYYAPGHGEFFQRLHVSGTYAKLIKQGIRYITFSNIDNLGASIDPLLIGSHIRSGRDMTVEVIRKSRNALGEWDVGGAPVNVSNRILVVEGFRLPRTLPPDALLDFQTNNMYFSLGALAEPPILPRYWVTKQIEGRPSVSFEAVTCEATGVVRSNGNPWLSLNLVRVPRRGARGRFFPVKTRDDLAAERDEIKARVHEGWTLRAREADG